MTEEPARYKILARSLSECLTSEEHSLSIDKDSNFEKYSKLFHGLGHDLVNVCYQLEKKNSFLDTYWIRNFFGNLIKDSISYVRC